MKQAIRIIGWIAISPVMAPQLVSLIAMFYTRHLFRRVVRKQPIPGLRAFWANPKA